MPRLDPELENHSPQASTEDEMICIEPEQGELVYKYYNEFLDKAATQRFEEHLVLCFYCQDIIFSLDVIEDALKENLDDLIPPPGPGPQVSASPVGNALAQNREILTPSTDTAPAGVSYAPVLEPKTIK